MSDDNARAICEMCGREVDWDEDPFGMEVAICSDACLLALEEIDFP